MSGRAISIKASGRCRSLIRAARASTCLGMTLIAAMLRAQDPTGPTREGEPTIRGAFSCAEPFLHTRDIDAAAELIGLEDGRFLFATTTGPALRLPPNDVWLYDSGRSEQVAAPEAVILADGSLLRGRSLSWATDHLKWLHPIAGVLELPTEQVAVVVWSVSQFDAGEYVSLWSGGDGWAVDVDGNQIIGRWVWHESLQNLASDRARAIIQFAAKEKVQTMALFRLLATKRDGVSLQPAEWDRSLWMRLRDGSQLRLAQTQPAMDGTQDILAALELACGVTLKIRTPQLPRDCISLRRVDSTQLIVDASSQLSRGKQTPVGIWSLDPVTVPNGLIEPLWFEGGVDGVAVAAPGRVVVDLGPVAGQVAIGIQRLTPHAWSRRVADAAGGQAIGGNDRSLASGTGDRNQPAGEPVTLRLLAIEGTQVRTLSSGELGTTECRTVLRAKHAGGGTVVLLMETDSVAGGVAWQPLQVSMLHSIEP